MPCVLYTEDDICQAGDTDGYVEARTNDLWSKVIKNLFQPVVSEGEYKPFRLKALEER